MLITDVYSIELDRTKPFDMKIHFKDNTGFILDSISVTQINADQVLQLVTNKWWAAIQRKENES